MTSDGAPASRDDFTPVPRSRLLELLADAQRFRFIGPAPVEDHLEVGLTFGRTVQGLVPTMLRVSRNEQGVHDPVWVADLGAGGGVPGLVGAATQPDWRTVLVESNHRRAEFLELAVEQLGLGAVEVCEARAEDIARQDTYRQKFDLVLARGFGPPALVAECAAPLLRADGLVLISEPPDADGSRWPSDGIQEVGLVAHELRPGRPAIMILRQQQLCGDRFPRRSGIPRKRPLF